MIDMQRFDEVEMLIKEGRHGKARHVIRDMLAELKQHQPADGHQAEKSSIVAGLLSDTLDSLLLFYHESQISVNAIRAARLLTQSCFQVTPIGRKSSWRDVCW